MSNYCWWCGADLPPSRRDQRKFCNAVHKAKFSDLKRGKRIYAEIDPAWDDTFFENEAARRDARLARVSKGNVLP